MTAPTTSRVQPACDAAGTTPGPWQVAPAAYGYDIMAMAANGAPLWIASVTRAVGGAPSQHYPSAAACEANARSIAAVPNLAAALQVMTALVRGSMSQDSDVVQAALARAEAALAAADPRGPDAGGGA